MGSEKAFLDFEGRSFVASVSSEMSRVSDDVLVMVGRKETAAFAPHLGPEVRLLNDDYYIANPLGGIRSGLGRVKHPHSAIVACDAPLLRAEVIQFLHDSMGEHSAAVPIWEEDEKGTMEPLCAVYEVEEAKKATAEALGQKEMTVKGMVMKLRDPLFVDVSQLRLIDPELDSLVDVNTKEQYLGLRGKSREARQRAVFEEVR